MKVLNGNEIIRAAMTDSGTTQVKMKDLLGYTSQATVSQRINTPRMSLDKFTEMLRVMGYEVIVRKSEVVEETGEVKYTDMWQVKDKE